MKPKASAATRIPDEDGFEELSDKIRPGIPRSRVWHAPVIKSHHVRDDRQVIIKADESDLDDDEEGLVQPIIEHNEVVGVIYRCTCGKVAEIRFQFERR